MLSNDEIAARVRALADTVLENNKAGDPERAVANHLVALITNFLQNINVLANK